MANNLAYKKPTKMSTISYDNPTYFGPMNAVDGNRNSDIKLKSCAASRQEMHAWWQVDLQAVYLITDVVITNRRDEMLGRKNMEWYKRFASKYHIPVSNGW